MLQTLVGNGVFTAIETVTLAIWLSLARTMRGALGVVVLFAGFVIEHTVQRNVAQRRPLNDVKDLPVGGLLGFSAIETVLWVTWLFLSMAFGHLIAFVFLAATLVVKHAIADNVIVGKAFFDFKYASDGRVVTASVLEATGAQLWLINVLLNQPINGLVLLFVFSFAEHLILIGVARDRLQKGA